MDIENGISPQGGSQLHTKNMQLNPLPAHFKETVRDHVFFKNLVTFQIKLNGISSALLMHKTIAMRPKALGGKQGEQKGTQLETGHPFTPYSGACRDPG